MIVIPSYVGWRNIIWWWWVDAETEKFPSSHACNPCKQAYILFAHTTIPNTQKYLPTEIDVVLVFRWSNLKLLLPVAQQWTNEFPILCPVRSQGWLCRWFSLSESSRVRGQTGEQTLDFKSPRDHTSHLIYSWRKRAQELKNQHLLPSPGNQILGHQI